MSRTLLLVDDSVSIQRVVELTFAHEDVRIVSMSDGQRALQWLEVEKADIVVVDVGVPEVDGYTVASRVKSAKRHKHVPVLLLASAFAPVDDARLREIGCDGVLVKPFEPKQLVERVKELIDVRPLKSAPREPAVHGAPAVPAAAAAIANPASLRAVRSMPPPAPEPPPPPQVAPEPVVAAAASGPIAVPKVASASATATLAPPSASTTADVAVEPPVPVPVARPTAPQPLELPSRQMWQGGAQPAPVPVALVAAPPVAISAPQTSAKAALVNAFSALLAADQAVPSPPMAPPAPAVAVVSDSMIENAVRRVIQTMTEEHVRRIVAETAERLVREEIERIKANPE